MRKKVLIIVAHPDDEVLGCGGTAANHILNKDTVFLLVFADGVTSRMHDSDRPENRIRELKINKKIIAQRRRDAVKAGQVLGLSSKNIYFLNLADQRLDGYLFLDLVKHVEKIRKLIQPDIVYTHFWGDLNLDHQLVCRATLTAFRPSLNKDSVKIFHFEIPESTYLSIPFGYKAFQPNHYVDITKVYSKKIKALKSYKGEQKRFPHYRSPEFLRKILAERGSQVGVAYAEAFIRIW